MFERKSTLEKLEDVAIRYGGTRHQLILYRRDRESLREDGFTIKELSPLNQKKACLCLVDWENATPGTVANKVLQMAKESLEKGHYLTHIN